MIKLIDKFESLTLTFIRAICVFCLIGGISVAVIDLKSTDLVAIHNEIQANYNTVNHIAAENFTALDTKKLVVFDVREAEEFAVSHLKGAVQIDPDMSPGEFTERFKNLTYGKTVVFYCSVGWRSSDFANRVNFALQQQGASKSYNLTGGLFQWHNENRPLTSRHSTDTNAIHPYDSHWGQLIDDQSAIRHNYP